MVKLIRPNLYRQRRRQAAAAAYAVRLCLQEARNVPSATSEPSPSAKSVRKSSSKSNSKSKS